MTLSPFNPYLNQKIISHRLISIEQYPQCKPWQQRTKVFTLLKPHHLSKCIIKTKPGSNQIPGKNTNVISSDSMPFVVTEAWRSSYPALNKRRWWITAIVASLPAIHRVGSQRSQRQHIRTGPYPATRPVGNPTIRWKAAAPGFIPVFAYLLFSHTSDQQEVGPSPWPPECAIASGLEQVFIRRETSAFPDSDVNQFLSQKGGGILFLSVCKKRNVTVG